MNENDVDIIERDCVYDGYMQLYTYRLRHRLFSGEWSREIKRELLERGDAVCVLPYDPVRDEVILVEQFRVAAHAAGLSSWHPEIVAGVIEVGETADDVARREAREEAGCEIKALHKICRAMSSSGVLTETATIYCAIVDTSDAGGIHGLPEEGEDIKVLVYPFEKALGMIEDGSFTYVQGIVALQWLAANRDRLRAENGVTADD